MLSKDPVLIILDLLTTNWTAGNTVLANDPKIHSGWYDFGSGDPQVTVTNPDEVVAEGGETGLTAGTGSGGVVQARLGTLLVNCWAGTRDDLSDAGSGGSSVNPKAAAYDMAGETHRIIQTNADGTTDANGDPQLHTVAASDARRIVDDDRDPVVFRYEVTVRYSYIETTA